MNQGFEIRPLNDGDKEWVDALLTEHWGSSRIVTRGQVHQADALPGFVAVEGDRRVGLVTYKLRYVECEIITLNSLDEGKGVATGLIGAVEGVAAAAGCQRIWLITTNDSTPALRFYQKRGFELVAIYRNALDRSRMLKPEIPKTGLDGIPIQDEIELEYIF